MIISFVAFIDIKYSDAIVAAETLSTENESLRLELQDLIQTNGFETSITTKLIPYVTKYELWAKLEDTWAIHGVVICMELCITKEYAIVQKYVNLSIVLQLISYGFNFYIQFDTMWLYTVNHLNIDTDKDLVSILYQTITKEISIITNIHDTSPS